MLNVLRFLSKTDLDSKTITVDSKGDALNTAISKFDFATGQN